MMRYLFMLKLLQLHRLKIFLSLKFSEHFRGSINPFTQTSSVKYDPTSELAHKNKSSLGFIIKCLFIFFMFRKNKSLGCSIWSSLAISTGVNINVFKIVNQSKKRKVQRFCQKLS